MFNVNHCNGNGSLLWQFSQTSKGFGKGTLCLTQWVISAIASRKIMSSEKIFSYIMPWIIGSYYEVTEEKITFLV
ncbi:MAG: hypothetical protein ACKO2V_02275 [Snowella sp.]